MHTHTHTYIYIHTYVYVNMYIHASIVAVLIHFTPHTSVNPHAHDSKDTCICVPCEHTTTTSRTEHTPTHIYTHKHTHTRRAPGASRLGNLRRAAAGSQGGGVRELEYNTYLYICIKGV
jgi:hypothetical protein